VRFTTKRDGPRATVATTHIVSTLVDATRHRPTATGVRSNLPSYAMTRTGSPDTRTT
jgi:hypothetical protein